MADNRLSRFLREAEGAHFLAVLGMGPVAAAAIVVLQQFHLVAHTPIWMIPAILVGGQFITTAAGVWRNRAPSRLSTQVWIVARVALVTATIYATGWGPALAVGLVLIGQETLAVSGTSWEKAMLAWTVAALAVGETLIAVGWVPSLIPVPAVHGLAVLMAIGIAFSNRSLRSALIDKDDAAAMTESREHRFRALVQSSSDLVFCVDSVGTVTYASPSCRRVLGFEPEEMLGTETSSLVHPGDMDGIRDLLGGIWDRPYDSAEFSLRIRNQAGAWRWIEGVATNLLEDNAVAGVVINARDITERRAYMERQSATSELGRRTLQATTLEESLEAAAEIIARIVGFHDCRISRVVGGEAGGTEVIEAVLWPGHRSDPIGVPLAGSSRLRVPVGDPAQPLAYIDVVTDHALAVEEVQFVDGAAGILASAIVRFDAEDAIRYQALHDPLTGLPNRILFNDRLEHALSRLERSISNVVTMIIDLDGFKNVNDSLGHLAGDALLVAVADRLQANVRGFDTIARLGGDEFAMLFDDVETADRASVMAQRVLDEFINPLELPDRQILIGASLGISITDRADAKAERLIADADAAMYQAKRHGKGCYRLFEDSMFAVAFDRMNLEQDLRAAIRNGDIDVHYQPIVTGGTRSVESFEALARWRHPVRGFVSPATFVPLAEELGLIADLGRAVLRQACRQAKEWHERFPAILPSISVNVSQLQLGNARFVDHVTEALARSGLDPSYLVVEVTESMLASESGVIIASLDRLRQMGVRVAIDDFGTGYSSFAALADLPIDIIKIDKRFVDKLLDEDHGEGVVMAIMQLANTLGLETTAEGVERPQQRAILEQLGCTSMQGFLFASAMPGSETMSYLTRQARATEFDAVAAGADSTRREAG
jgi:diguanylate cyclase (GGDEF)-like protein/PAS domain S-box-containing protein